MNILVITQQYPKEGNIYMNGFVHTRIKAYQNYYSDTYKVFVLNNNFSEYIYDGVSVTEGNKSLLAEELSKKYDRIIIHFLTEKMIPVILKNAQHIEKYIWIHGYEALSWKRRLFNLTHPDFLKYVILNTIQLKQMKKFVKEQKNTTFIFVSEWMKQIAEKDIGVNFKGYKIIPNGIDNETYSKQDKNGLEKNILLIRPFNSRKYATDIALKALEILSKKKNFLEYKITIVGEGKYFEKDTSPIKNFSNVHFINRFLKSDEIAELHRENGIFLCPTRQDSQGVSMCEAMSSGLVVISSNNTAIPEFVRDKKTGYLADSPEEIAEIIEVVSMDNEKFAQVSNLASKFIIDNCNLNDVIKKEVKLIKGAELT
ncbi:hypothetical protein IGJ48_001831 [Enterococcus pernyi]